MGTLRQLSTRINAAVAIYDITLQQTIEETAPEIVPDYVRTQMYSGITGLSQKITPQYGTDEYAKIKFKDNPKPGLKTPDLYLYGDFYNGIAVVVNAKSFVTSSSDSKAGKLELKYGSDIYKLTSENRSAYSLNTVKPALFAKLKSQITGCNVRYTCYV